MLFRPVGVGRAGLRLVWLDALSRDPVHPARWCGDRPCNGRWLRRPAVVGISCVGLMVQHEVQATEHHVQLPLIAVHV